MNIKFLDNWERQTFGDKISGRAVTGDQTLVSLVAGAAATFVAVIISFFIDDVDTVNTIGTISLVMSVHLIVVGVGVHVKEELNTY